MFRFNVLRRPPVYLLFLLKIPIATAGPMGFQNSWMTMGDMGPNWREVFINYAVTPRDAFGVSQTYMRADDDSVSRNLTEVTYTRLVKRWNQPHSQSNLWFVGGIGDMRMKDHDADTYDNRLAASPGLQADFETTRLYFSGMHRLYRASEVNHDYSAIRTGFSFYEAEYEQTQPWLLVEARYMNDLSDRVEVTPMVRLINRNYFVEAGANNFGQPRFNFMFIF